MLLALAWFDTNVTAPKIAKTDNMVDSFFVGTLDNLSMAEASQP
jgi:hypothetical protein